jgi:hypothetical protein
MRTYFFSLMLLLPSLGAAQELNPILNVYLYENRAEEESTEILFMSEFQSRDPSTQPFSSALGIAETFIQAASVNNSDLNTLLEETNQSQEIGDHISQLDRAIKLQFLLPKEKGVALISFLDIIEEMPAQIGKINPLVHERTKQNLAETTIYFDQPERGALSKELASQLFELTPHGMINSFMEKSFPENKNTLIIAYPKDGAAIATLVKEKILSFNDQWNIVDHQTAPIKSVDDTLVSKSIEKADKGIVIDGKIFMDSPHWWQKQRTGTFLGVGLLVIGILSTFFTFGIGLVISIPVAITGIVFLASSYLADPGVIENLRKEINKSGFHYGYKKQCIGIALTPFERRHFFVRDIFDRYGITPRKITDFASYYALESYNYKMVEMRDFLYIEENSQLSQFQADYRAYTSRVAQMIRDLDNELDTLLLPHQIMRDIAVESAYAEFNNSTSVVLHNLYIDQYENEKKHIKQMYKDNTITLDEKTEALNQLKEDLQNNLRPLAPYIQEAEEYLDYRLQEIKAEYKLNVIYCKNNINYDSRMQGLKNAKWNAMDYFSDLMSHYIMDRMNPNDSNFADRLDLRRNK